MPEENKEQKSSADLEWEQFSELVAERDDVSLPDGDLSGIGNSGDNQNGGAASYGSLSQRMANSPKLSDAQTFDLRLFPQMKTQWLNILQVSRVFPDTYDDLFMIFVKDLLSEYKDMTVGEAIALVHTSLSIAIDGEGRIDELQLASGMGIQSDGDKNKSTLGF
jgi:hypothetical protein